MRSRHRPGHSERGHGGSEAPPAGERVLVLPGEEIAAQGLKPGPGTYRVQGRTYASVLGLVTRRPPVVRVVPLSGRYIPSPDDIVVGTVADVQGTFWLLDIGAPRWAPLHMTGTPWTIEFGETEQYLRVGDSVVVAVERLEASGRIGVTMKGEGLGKLEGGALIPITPARVPRLIGRGGSMIQTILRHTGAQIVVGQNGRIWVNGSDEAIRRVRACLRLIDEEGQRSGLTERIESLLRSGETPEEEERQTVAVDDPTDSGPYERRPDSGDRTFDGYPGEPGVEP
jgi:exosome complex component RRP4